MGRKVRIAVIGVGYLGRHHARILSELPEVELIGVVDTNADLASEVSQQFNTKAFSDYRDILNEANALCIATPTDTHYPIAIDCLANNRHLFIEKPITSNPSDAKLLADMASAQGLIIHVGHIERFNPVFAKALKTIKRPELIESERVSPFLERAANVDVVKDLMIHDIDLILALLRSKGLDGSIRSLHATGISLVTTKTDLAIACIEFGSGVRTVLKAGRIERDKNRQMTIYEGSNYMRLDLHRQSIMSFRAEDCSFTEEVLEADEELLRLELASFVDSLTKGRPPAVSAIDAMEALKVAEQINNVIEVSKR